MFNSHQAKNHGDWKQAQNFFVRNYEVLAQEEKDLLQDWEFVLCNMCTLEPVAFLPLLQRCFQHVETFVTQNAEALKNSAAKTIETALRFPQTIQFPMATFSRIFLERYKDKLSTEQMESVSMWEENLCTLSAVDLEARIAKRAEALTHVQAFFVKFADEIVELQKQTVRDVVNSHQANAYPEWNQAKNFFVRHHGLLAQEEKDLLQDWEFVLCNMCTLEPVAFLPLLQRCFQHVETFVTQNAEALKNIAAKTIETALRFPEMIQFPMATFSRIFLERYKDKLSTEQMESVSMWEENLCTLSAVDLEARIAKRVEAFAHVQAFCAKFADEILELQKQTLRDVFNSHQAKNHGDWKQAQNFFVRNYEVLAQEEKDLLQDWEFVLCNMCTLEPVAFLPLLQRCFQRMERFVNEQSFKLKLSKQIALVDAFQSIEMQSTPMCCFCAVFLKRYLDRLSAAQIVEVKKWESDLCVTETELVNKFVDMLQRREADLKTLVATSVDQLFGGHRKKTDADLRFGYDFMRRSWSQLSLGEQQRVRQALEPILFQVEQMPAKAVHEPKLFVGETGLGNKLPRPRLPKSLRQLYGNSMDAESRIMPFFHRVNEVDAHMLKLEFQDCSYCKEGWFGIHTGGDKSRLPGGVESQAFQKTNFCQAPEREWLEPGITICENCLIEAKKRVKAGMPKEPFRLTEANFADPGETLPETDALTFFEEELLSPIQHLVRIFTLYSTGQCELRGHVGNLFQNGPQFVRDIPAAIGDMKMLLIRRCPKDPHRKQRVPFLVSRLRLQRALDRVFKPVEEGGSVAMRPGGLTPEGYLGFVNRENLEQYSNTEEGEEPEGLEWQHCDQEIWTKMEKKLFVMWMSSRLSLQLAAHVRHLHEPEESDSDADRIQKTWDSLREKLEELSFADVGGPDELVTSTLVGYLVSTYLTSDHPLVQGSVFSDDPTAKSNCPSHERVEQILHDELTAVQELAAWTEQPLVPEGFWSPEDLSAQQTEEDMQEGLWNALAEAQRSDAALTANVKHHGAGRVEGLPLIDPPTVLSRNQLIREDHPYYIAAGFLKLFPLGYGDYWAHVPDRADNLCPLSFWEWLKHLLLRSDGRFQSHPRFYFFALNTALRNKALRARTYFVKKQVGLNTSDSYTNEQLMNMGKAQFTKVIAAFEQAMIGSAQEKLQQRSDLEALVEQIEQETLEQKAQEVLSVWHATKKAGKEALEEGRPEYANWTDQCVAAQKVLETVLEASAFSGDVTDVACQACAFSGHAERTASAFSGDAGDNVEHLLKILQKAVDRMKAGGEIPCHFTTLTTAIYHWQDLAQMLEKYDRAVTQRRHGRRDPLEPSERKLSRQKLLVLKYPGAVAFFTTYKMELFYKHVLKYEDGEGVFEWGAGGIMHLHSINFGSQMPRVDPSQEEWRLPCMESIRTAQEFAEVHEEYVTDWSLSKAEKWSEQDVENAAARRTGSDSPLHSDAESDGSEDMEPESKRARVMSKSDLSRMSFPTATATDSKKQDSCQSGMGDDAFCQHALASDEDFVRAFPTCTTMVYVKDAAGQRKVSALTSNEKELLQHLNSLLQQEHWHPCQIGTEVKKILMTNNCQVVRRMRRKFYRKLSEKCNMHDRHGGVGLEVPPILVEMPVDQTAGDQKEMHIETNHEVAEISVGSLNLHMQPLRADVREMISEHDAFCLQEVTPVTLPSILTAGREMGYDVVSPAQRGHTMLEGFDVCILLRKTTLKRLRVGIVPLSPKGIRHMLHVQVQVKKNGACLAVATAHCTASKEERNQRTAELEVIWGALEALTVDGCIFAGDTNMHAEESIALTHQEHWDDAWVVDGGDAALSGTWCQEWMDPTHPSVETWRFDRLCYQTKVFHRSVIDPRDASVTEGQVESSSVDAAVTFLSGKHRKLQGDATDGGTQKQRMVRSQSLRLVKNSFQRTWGVGLSDHACISGMFLVEAGAVQGQLPEAEYLCVVRPGLGTKVARRPKETESCAHKTQSLPFCSKDYEKARMAPGQGAILEDSRRKGLYRLYTRRNCHHVNTHDPLKAIGLVANVDDQVVLTIQAAINYLTKYMGKLGTGHILPRVALADSWTTSYVGCRITKP